MKSTIAIDIDAPADLVFRLARDVERWERLLPHYVRSRVIGPADQGTRVVEFIARRTIVRVLGLGVPVVWRARVWAEPDPPRLQFVHVAGATKGMHVTWRIEPTASGAHVAIEHAFSPRLPGVARFVDVVFTRPIAGRTLATFKALAETLWEVEQVGDGHG